jgi:hypothetical protein
VVGSALVLLRVQLHVSLLSTQTTVVLGTIIRLTLHCRVFLELDERRFAKTFARNFQILSGQPWLTLISPSRSSTIATRLFI